jgi:DNA-binding NarL/FixJ family response regulator
MTKRQELSCDDISMRLLGVIAVKGLPQIQQIAVLSRVGLSPKAIAELLGTTANTVRVALVSIRKAEKAGKRTGLLREEADSEKV